jgi:hypothetical protein
MDQQRWQDPASPAPTARTPQANLEHGSRDAGAWAATPWAVVTATGIVQARCGQPTPAGACAAWRLSAPRRGTLETLLCLRQRRDPGRGPGAGPTSPQRSPKPDRQRRRPHDHAHYAEAFHPAEGRCFRFVSVAGTYGQPTHCPAPPAWRGLYVGR